MVSREDLEKMSPNIDQFMKIENSGAIRGVIITLRARENEGYDFYSRYFAPWVGIPEDPVTGSAHTVLAPYWGKVYSKYQFQGESMEKIPLLFLSKGQYVLNRDIIATARQCSKRGGDLSIEIVGQRIEMTGKVAHVMEGILNIE